MMVGYLFNYLKESYLNFRISSQHIMAAHYDAFIMQHMITIHILVQQHYSVGYQFKQRSLDLDFIPYARLSLFKHSPAQHHISLNFG